MFNYLKCDADDCDFRLEIDDYGPHYIGYECHECGESILTQDDFNGAEPMRKLMDLMVSAGLARPATDDDEGPLMTYNFHNGKTKIEVDGK